MRSPHFASLPYLPVEQRAYVLQERVGAHGAIAVLLHQSVDHVVDTAQLLLVGRLGRRGDLDHVAQVGEQFAALNQISQGKAPAADLATQAEVLSITAGVAKGAFTPKVPGGEAKPEVWEKWDDFSKRLDDMVAAAQDVAKAAKQGGVAAVTPKLSSLSCKGCHDVYRVEKK